MRIRGAARVRRAARRLTSRVTRGAVVLLYHRVAQLPTDPALLAVTPQHFAEHLEVLRTRFHPLRLDGLPKLVSGRGRLPRRGVAVTLDDGYADNLHSANPLLERVDVPATVFVATGQVGTVGEFWVDRLERLLLHPGRLPSPLRVSVNGRIHEWDLGSAATYTSEDFEQHRRWSMRDPVEPTARQAAYRALSILLQPRPNAERQGHMDDISAVASIDPQSRPTHRVLSPAELVHLANGHLVEIGCHTVSHPVLAALPVDDQRVEIEHSKAALEEMTGRSVTSFAYPYGQRLHYTSDTVAIVRDAGFGCAASNFRGVVGNTSDVLQVPRFQVADCDGDTFARHLNKWFCE